MLRRSPLRRSPLRRSPLRRIRSPIYGGSTKSFTMIPSPYEITLHDIENETTIEELKEKIKRKTGFTVVDFHQSDETTLKQLRDHDKAIDVWDISIAEERRVQKARDFENTLAQTGRSREELIRFILKQNKANDPQRFVEPVLEILERNGHSSYFEATSALHILTLAYSRAQHPRVW